MDVSSQPHLLEPGHVDVWLTRPQAVRDEAILNAYRRILSDEETQRCRRFHFERHRHTFLVAHALVRTSLSHYHNTRPADWQFQFNKYGHPTTLGSHGGLKFNLSHTDGLVACAVTREAEVGVDVEASDREVDVRVADRFFSALETRELKSLPATQRQHRFLQYWTLKESYIKARGMGLALPLGGFAFTIESSRAPRISFDEEIDDDAGRWQFASLSPVSGFLLGLCVEKIRAGDQLNFRIRETVPAP